MNDPIIKLKEMGIKLPEVSKPGGSYNSVNIRNSIAYVAIQFPILNGEFKYLGRLGQELSAKDGYEAMKLSALNVIAQINEKVAFETVIGLNHLDAYYQSSETWDEGPNIVNGASDFFLEVLGERGAHSRSIFGVHKLPGNLSVGITTSFSLR